MTSNRNTHLTLLSVAAAVLVACGGMPAQNARLDQARTTYNQAQADAQVQALAPSELSQARQSLARAEAAYTAGEPVAEVDHLAYLTQQRTALAQAVASRKTAEAAVVTASTERDRQRLAARTQEADSATRAATSAQQESAALLQQAGAVQNRNTQLEAELRDLNARQTERGMVVTIGDLLFRTGSADLQTVGLGGIDQLGRYLRQDPARQALIEGYTDSTGGTELNQRLSSQRADAVMAALLTSGVARGQMTVRGYGESHPAADNRTADGRQLNRRVEVVLSDAQGRLIGR